MHYAMAIVCGLLTGGFPHGLKFDRRLPNVMLLSFSPWFDVMDLLPGFSEC